MKSIFRSKKVAIIISYIMIMANTVSNLLLTPLYIKFLGLDTYGLYQMIYSVAHYILILDFGISTTMVRYISMYHAEDDYQKEKNFSAHCLGIVLIIVVAVAILGIILNGSLTRIYPTISPTETQIAHYIFGIMVVTIAITIIEHFLQGIIMAYEYFTVVKIISLLKIVLKICITVIMLIGGMGVVAIVFADLIVSLCSVVALLAFSLGVIKFKIEFSCFDKLLVKSIIAFMIAIFLQSIVAYVNNVVDKTILGIMTTKENVAVYSVAMTFITLFNSLPSAISGVFLPQAAKIVGKNENRKSLTAFVVRPGRYQFMICGAIIVGFVMFGKEFIQLWVGESSMTAWTIALIIMVPNMIPLIENTVINILDIKKKRLFRSLTLLGISIINVIVSIILVSQYGILGAPIGTAFAYFVGYGIVLNIYYEKVIDIDVLRMFKSIFSRTWICVVGAGITSIPMNYLFKTSSWVNLGLKGFIFCTVYAILLFIYGLNETEKKDIASIGIKIKRRK